MAEDPAVGTPAPAAPATPWYQGVVDADVLGGWQNKGYDLSDPVKVAVEAGKAARELERMVGVPKDQLLRLPANANDPTAWRPVYERLGAPKEAKDYDFANVKYTDGSELEPALIDGLRQAFHARGVSKEAAVDIAKAVVKVAETENANTATELEVKRNSEVARLDQLWGQKKNENMLTAMNGARRAGFTPEQVKAMEGAVGIDVVGEFFRKLGAATNEDTFVDGAKTSGSPATAEAAKSRLNDLKSDADWTKRYLAGSAKEVREFKNLMAQITGINEETELASL